MKKKHYLVRLALAAAVVSMGAAPGSVASALAQCGHGAASHEPGHASASHDGEVSASVSKTEGDPYLLPTDPVSGRRLPADPIVTSFQGRELRFSNQASFDRFMKAPEKYLDKVDQAMIDRQLPYYPIDTCIVSGEKLGEDMGPPVDKIVGNRLVRFCCKDCVSKYDKNPERYASTLNEAVIRAQKASYPSRTCVVSGEALDSMEDPVDIVLGNQLIRLCCSNCEKKLRADPIKYIGRLSKS